MNPVLHLTVLTFAICAFSTCVDIQPHSCPANEHFTTCINDCPTPVCADPRPPSCQTLVCNPGCECNRGYVRVSKPNGACISISKCINCLRRDFIFNKCGSGCNNTCEEVLSGNDVCLAVCVPGCYCKKGVFDRHSNRCIPPKQCIKRNC